VLHLRGVDLEAVQRSILVVLRRRLARLAGRHRRVHLRARGGGERRRRRLARRGGLREGARRRPAPRGLRHARLCDHLVRQQRAQHVRVRALQEELVALQHQLHLSVVLRGLAHERLHRPRQLRLAQPVQYRQDLGRLQTHRHGGVQAVRRQLIFVHRVRPAHRLRDGDQEVARRLVGGREGLQHHPAVGADPERPVGVVRLQHQLRVVTPAERARLRARRLVARIRLLQLVPVSLQLLLAKLRAARRAARGRAARLARAGLLRTARLGGRLLLRRRLGGARQARLLLGGQRDDCIAVVLRRLAAPLLLLHLVCGAGGGVGIALILRLLLVTRAL